MSSRGARNRGGMKACAVVVIIVFAWICFGAFIWGRLVAAPDLGAAPRGPSHGTTATAIAASLAGIALQEIRAQGHGSVVLSEQDLTVIAHDDNPKPETFTNPQVRIRNGHLLVSATTTVGPLSVIAVAQVEVTLQQTADGKHVVTSITGLDLGRQTVPPLLRDIIDSRGSAALALDPLFNGSATLQALRSHLECIATTPVGIEIGFRVAPVGPNSGSDGDCAQPAFAIA